MSFSNSESEGDSASVCGSTLVTWSSSDGDASASGSEEDDDLPAKAGFGFRNLTTAEGWKIAEARLPGNKWANPSTTSGVRCYRKKRQNKRVERKKEETAQLGKTYGSITRFFANTSSEPHPQPELSVYPPGGCSTKPLHNPGLQQTGR